jgi:hypothetical protein
MLEDFIVRCKKAELMLTDDADWRELHDTLTCDDIRYLDYDSAILLDIFVKNNGIERHKENITMPLPDVKTEDAYYGRGNVQILEKAALSEILKARGFSIVGYEVNCRIGEADLTASNEADVRVYGEVGACRVTKVIDTFPIPPYAEAFEDSELWHLPYPEPVDDGRKLACQLFVYRRGRNWKNMYEIYMAARMATLSKAMGILDGNNSNLDDRG